MRAYSLLALFLIILCAVWYWQREPEVSVRITESLIDQQGSSLDQNGDIQQSWSQSYQTAKIDFAIFDFTAKQFSPAGVLQQHLTGSKMLHLSPKPSATPSALPQLRYVISNPEGDWLDGEKRHIKAARALANADFAIIDWHHQVALQQGTGDAQLKLETDNLLQTPQQFNAIGNVHLSNSAGEINAEKLEFDHRQQLLNFKGPVHSVYKP